MPEEHQAGQPASRWWLYIADCDGRLYTGITTDVPRRINEHRRGLARAARFTRAAKEVELVYHASVGDRTTALRLERRVKRLPRERKRALVNEAPDGHTLIQRLLAGA
ncbi:MAG: GIY-YIG nuclease family protein [Spirochaetaceae bacterium]|nr:MAG: GIY-YIG nuclease family protein [Spirochaetaceae bacterium]